MRIGLTCGAFDLCHAGHMLMFKECKEKFCDYLIVGLQVDPSTTPKSYRGKKKAKPVMSLFERLIILEQIKHIDEIFIYTDETDLFLNLQTKRHDVRILGADWQHKIATGQWFAKERVYNSRGHGFSTTELKERIKKSK